MHDFLTGIDVDKIKDPSERIEAFVFMERNLVKIAQEKGYQVLITCNLNKFTQDLAEHVFGFEVVNYFTDLKNWIDVNYHNEKPFELAEEGASVKICAKRF